MTSPHRPSPPRHPTNGGRLGGSTWASTSNVHTSSDASGRGTSRPRPQGPRRRRGWGWWSNTGRRRTHSGSAPLPLTPPSKTPRSKTRGESPDVIPRPTNTGFTPSLRRLLFYRPKTPPTPTTDILLEWDHRARRGRPLKHSLRDDHGLPTAKNVVLAYLVTLSSWASVVLRVLQSCNRVGRGRGCWVLDPGDCGRRWSWLLRPGGRRRSVNPRFLK